MPLKVGIISANWGAVAHLPAWRAVSGVEVTSICTSRRETAEAAAAKFDVARPFWDYEAMCADPDLDIIDCGTRPSLRLGMVLAAFQHGKHVYNGIPFAANLDEASEMRAAWKRSGKSGGVDAVSQWLPAHRLMKELIDAGKIGEVFGGACRFNTPLFNQPHPAFPFNWFSQGGHGVSAVRNMGSHLLHTLYPMFGAVEEVVADDRMLLKKWVFEGGGALTPKNNDLANALLRFEQGVVLQFQVSWSAALGEGWVIDVFGSKGRITVSDNANFPTSQGSRVRLGRLGGAMEEVEIPDGLKTAAGVSVDWSVPLPPVYPMALSMRAMVDEINGQARVKSAPDFEQAWQVERVQEAIRLSAQNRSWVKLTDIRQE